MEQIPGERTLPKMRVAMVTNIPAPYRLPVYIQLAQRPELDVHVVFCSGREPDREWNLGRFPFAHTFLGERFLSFRGRFIHINQDVWQVLHRLRPDVVITTGFNPTHLIAFAFACVHGARHVAMTDGTFESERSLTPFHRWIRRGVFARTRAFVGASDGSFDLYRSYGIDEALLFKSHLCANNAAFPGTAPVHHRYDFIFCGRFVAIKNPLFALAVAQGVAKRLGRKVSIAYVGSGELGAEMRATAARFASEVDAVFPGFSRQEELPGHYRAARIFLFPTQWDPWGVVANEACAAGLPVLVTPAAGSAGELIRDGENGYVLPLDLERWVDAACRLLTDEALHARFSARSRALVADYTYDNAAQGICDAMFAATR